MRLIEKGFPCHQVGAETLRERDTGKAPPVNRLHVWWARRPLTPSRAAITASLAPADTDPETFLRRLGIEKVEALVHGIPWTLTGPLLEKIETGPDGAEYLPVDDFVLKRLAEEEKVRSENRKQIADILQHNVLLENDPTLTAWQKDIVGSQQISLLPVTREEFEKLAQNPRFAGELEETAGKRADLFKKRTASREIEPKRLYEIYSRMSRIAPGAEAPVRLEDIWATLSRSRYLEALGCRAHGHEEKKVLHLSGLDFVDDKTFLTTSRETFDRGDEELESGLRFATYGEPIFERLLSEVTRHGLPDCVRRIEVEEGEGDLKIPVVGYVVATGDGEGGTRCRLITSFGQLEGLELDEAPPVTDDHVREAREELQALAREDLHVHLRFPSLEQKSREAAGTQKVVNFLIARWLLGQRKSAEQDKLLFWKEMEGIEAECRKQASLRIRGVPMRLARKLENSMVDVHLPASGDTTYMDVTGPFIRVALEALCREADAMKKKKSELTTDEVLARLERLIEQA